MVKFILKRLIFILFSLFLISIIIFYVSEKLPGDPHLQKIINRQDVNYEQLEIINKQYNLNEPITTKYYIWITKAIKGDFGKSYLSNRNVIILIQQKLFNTFFLGFMSLFFILGIGIPLGMLSAKYENTLIDKFITSYNFFTLAVPNFIIGILLLYYFGYVLKVFPTSGSIDPYIYEYGSLLEKFISRIYYTLLPSLTIGLLTTTTVSQYLRNEIIITKNKDFIKTAKSKGQKDYIIYFKHILKNAFIPLSSVLGFYITGIFAGSIVIESIFTYPGIGKFFIDAITLNDTPVIVALTIYMSLLTLFGSLISDIIIKMVDPRININ